MKDVLELAWLALPVVCAGFVHLLVLARDLMPGLRSAPIDFGLTWRGRRVFGANKTWRGVLVMVLATPAFAWLLAWINARWLHVGAPTAFAQLHPVAWGALLGAGYIVGELPNSFVKRQLGIAPGAMGSALTGKIFWLVDQLDSLAGMLLFVSPFWRPDPALLVAVVALMLIAHPVGAWIMMLAGLKNRVG